MTDVDWNQNEYLLDIDDRYYEYKVEEKDNIAVFVLVSILNHNFDPNYPLSKFERFLCVTINI